MSFLHQLVQPTSEELQLKDYPEYELHSRSNKLQKEERRMNLFTLFFFALFLVSLVLAILSTLKMGNPVINDETFRNTSWIVAGVSFLLLLLFPGSYVYRKRTEKFLDPGSQE